MKLAEMEVTRSSEWTRFEEIKEFMKLDQRMRLNDIGDIMLGEFVILFYTFGGSYNNHCKNKHKKYEHTKFQSQIRA